MTDRFNNPFKAQSGMSSIANTFGKSMQNLFSVKGPSASNIGGMFKTFMGGTGRSTAWGSLSGFSGSGGTGYNNPFGASSGMSSPWGSMTQATGLRKPSAQTVGGVGLGAGGKATRDPSFGQFSKTPQVYDFIDQAAAKYGVDANVMQVFIAKESSGDWMGNGNAGQGMYIGRNPWNDTIYPYIGTFRNTALSRGVTPQEWDAAAGNMGAQVDMLGRMLKSMIDQNGFTSPENLFAYYFSGQTDPNSQWSDGTMTVKQYVDSAMGFMQQLGGPAAGGSGLGGAAASGAVASIWGGKGERDLSYGFNAPNNLGYYSYGAQYGMNGNGHTGVDIPMNIGENVVSPVSGTVVCGGTGVGSGADGGGCAAFADVMGRGAGRVEVLLDSGETVIFGHMSASNFSPGQRINAGQVIGQAGGMNGAHVHLEWRVRDPSTSSGWRIVDPMGKLGQGGTTMNAAGQTAGSQTIQRTRRMVGGYII